MDNIKKVPDSTPPTKPSENKDLKQSAFAPIDDVKKFQDFLKREEQKPKKEEKKESNESPFKKITPPQKPISEIQKKEALQAAIGQIKPQQKSKDEMKPIKEGKSDGKSKSQEPSQEELIAKVASLKQEKKESQQERKESQEGTPIQIQSQTTGPLGQSVSSVSATPSIRSDNSREIAELATTMLTKLQASHELSTAGKEVRLGFGDTNPNLKGVEAIVSRDNQGTLKIEFVVQNTDANNYINQNKGLLNTNLQTELKDKFTDIRIDIRQTGPDTQDQNRRGRSQTYQEYIPEEDQT